MFRRLSALCLLLLAFSLPGRPAANPVHFNLPARNARSFQEISDAGCPGGKAYCLRSYLDEAGNLVKGSVYSAVIEPRPGEDLVVDYEYKADSEEARYGLLVVGADSRTRILTLVISGDRFQILGGGGRVLDAGPFTPGKYQRFRYVLHHESRTFDVYRDGLARPVVAGEGFRDGQGVPGMRLFSLGSPYGESCSWFADVKYGHANIAAPPPETEDLVSGEGASWKPAIFNFPARWNARSFRKVSDAGHPDGGAYCLRSYKDEAGKLIKGSVSSAVIEFGEHDQAVVDYDFKADSPYSRYALLLVGPESRIRLLTLVVEGDRFRILGVDGRSFDAGRVRFGEYQHIRYVLCPLAGRCDVFVDDMDKPAAENLEFRDRQAVAGFRLFSLGHPTTESATFFARVRYSLSRSASFPSPTLGRAPFFIAAAGAVAGRPTEKDWEQAPCYPLPSLVASRNRTTCRILRDQDRLFLRFDCRTGKFAPPPPTGRDGRLWLHDCLEVFIAPDPSRDEYFHFAGDAAGERYDARCIGSSGARDASWNGDWTLQARRNGDGWLADAAIAFANFGGRPDEGGFYLVNLCRENPGERELFSWSSSDRFHDSRSWGRLFFRRSGGSHSDFATEYFQNGKAALEVEGLFREIRRDFPSAEQGRMLAACELDLDKAVGLYGRKKDFFSQHAFHQTLAGTLERLRKARASLNRRKAIFSPGSRSDRRGFHVKAHTFMTRLSPDDFDGQGDERLELSLAGGEYGGGQVSLLLRNPLPEGAKVAVNIGGIPDWLRVRTFRMLAVAATAPWKAPRSYFDIMQPGSAFPARNDTMMVFAADFQVRRETPAQVFQGEIRLDAPGLADATVPFSIAAAGFDLPERRSLDTAFCFNDTWTAEFYGRPMRSAEKRNFLRFISEHRLEPMDLWGREPDVGKDHLDFCRDELGKQLLFLKIERVEESRELIRKYAGRLRPVLFGHDEVLGSPEKIPAMQRDFRRAGEEFPGVDRLMTARIDRRLFGYVDVWCPKFDHFRVEDAAARRRLGEKVWWYCTEYPLQPFPNFNLESPGVDARIIPWMNWKFDVAGLLYWGLNREWRTNAKEGGLLSDEEIRQRRLDWITPVIRRKMASGKLRFPDVPWLSYFRSISTRTTSRESGAGNMMYPGPGFEPWPSLRLKNLRDGLQDYECFALLDRNVRRLEKKGKDSAVLAEARKALAVDDRVVASPTGYTKDPDRLLQARRKLAELIVRTGKELE